MWNFIIKLANFNNINDILNILEQRCIWMEKSNINQWKPNSYTITFNKHYFKEQINNKKIYIAILNQKVCGVFLLDNFDKLWNNSEPALYIHHLATDIHFKGLGRIIIEYIKLIASQQNKNYIRLDCVSDNKKLNAYYEKLGFNLVETGTIKTYNYNLRELKL